MADLKSARMGVWETLRGELATATGREFERRALPLLRLFNRELIPVPELQDLDRAGIDLLVWSDDRRFPWVVQCKGFKAKEEIGKSQVKQVLGSIEKFRHSEFSCANYVLLHNRTGENREAVQEIEKNLSALREEGKATSTLLWDRQRFISKAKERLRDVIVTRMREDAEITLHQQERLFKFGSVYLPVVPISEKRLVISHGASMHMEERGRKSSRQSIADLIISPGDTRWTMLTGHFGTGKTTTALHAAKSKGHNVICVRGEEMADQRTGGISTNLMLSGVAEALHLFDDYDDETRKLAVSLAGQTLAGLLRGYEVEFALIIDGLDENRIYARADGMRRLTNELAELKCPIILTTRRDHFYSTFSNFQQTFQQLSRKGGAERSGRLFDFEMWTDQEVGEFLTAAAKICTPEQVDKLERFREALYSGEAKRLYGDLPKHPLFLQMLLEEVAEGRIAERNRAELIRDWMERKITRDLTVPRVTPTEIVDIDTFVSAMMVLQELTADLLTARGADGTLSLTEHVSSEGIEALACKVFGDRKVDISTILGCSVLSAVTRRSAGVIPVKFLLRVCQEFFLAAHLSRTGQEPSKYPVPVQEFWKELQEERVSIGSRL